MVADHPYKREYLEGPLRLHKLKLECLQKRMTLIPEGKTEYEKNEAILMKIATGGEIKSLASHVAEREAYLINYFQRSFLPDIEDMENNYGTVIEKASKRTEPEIKKVLSELTFETPGSVNIELKIHNYRLLKKLLA